MLPFGLFFPDFGPDPDFFHEIGSDLHKQVWIWRKMDELTLKIGLYQSEFNKEVDVLQSGNPREV